MSILLHVTLRRNLPSIQRHGIDPAFSRSQWRVCWFCHPRRRDWAIAHVADRYGVSPAEVIVLRISIPRIVAHAPRPRFVDLPRASSATSSPSPSPPPPESPRSSARPRGAPGGLPSKGSTYESSYILPPSAHHQRQG